MLLVKYVQVVMFVGVLLQGSNETNLMHTVLSATSYKKETHLSGKFFFKGEAPLEGMDRKISSWGRSGGFLFFLFFSFHLRVEALSSIEAQQIIVEGCKTLFRDAELELAASSGV